MRTTLLLLVLLLPFPATAQLSPGELTRQHAGLEGVGKCTLCHTVGKSLTAGKCLACHAEIGSRIVASRGYHATTAARPCSACHLEHNGRNFTIIRFDTRTFEHRSTGFPLNGGHAGVPCSSCHTQRLVADTAILRILPARPSTYLGLEPRCRACHRDVHGGQFAADCATCHTEAGWKPAARFTHDRARFPLAGAHAAVPCRQCHRAAIQGSQALQYRGVSFAGCQSCHEDPHRGKFSQACSACHAPESWRRVKGSVFDHAQTRFPLRGRHSRVPCARCHAPSDKLQNANGEPGFHLSRFGACADCHRDAHAGQFARQTDGGRCESCHSEEDFSLVLYGIDDHARAAFPLIGAHRATPCGACHTKTAGQNPPVRKFRWEGGATCRTCHADVHGGAFATRPCETCHAPGSWHEIRFDHDGTGFPLAGRHRTVRCDGCHGAGASARYAGTPRACTGCHRDVHDGELAREGTTSCERCHGPGSWHEVRFDHNSQSRFPLTGRHAAVPCPQCHRAELVLGKPVLRYRGTGTACEDCHRVRPSHEAGDSTAPAGN
jgi:hypothetical protein